MRSPLKSKSARRSRVSSAVSILAPVGGLNARDALADMKPYHAIAMTNWFPRTNYLEIRGGYIDYADGTDGTIKTLGVYSGAGSGSEMFAFTATGIYDVSTSGTVGASVLARTDGKHQYVNFGDGTNNWLIAVNGVDKPAYYNGSAWTAVDGATTPALTGLTTTSIANLLVFKGRLMFIEKDSLSFWYLASGVAGGALTEFSMAGVAKKGGYLVSGASWTMDGGSGPDDRAVFITSEGEVIVYAGTDPGSANSWQLVGVFEMGNPLGRRCFSKFGGDLVLINQQGAYPLSAALQSAIVDKNIAVTNIIEQAFNEASRAYGNNWGWEVFVYPAQSAMFVNVPIQEGGKHEQYVMNTTTKAWCKFTNWNAETFAVFNGKLYFATGTTVKHAWQGRSDDGANIPAYCKTAFSYFGDKMSDKRFNMFRPVLVTNGALRFLTGIDVDFSDAEVIGQASYTTTNNAIWDEATWDSAYWAAGMEVLKEWTSPDGGIGKCAAGKIKIATNSLTVQWMSSDYIFESGGLL